MSDEQSYYEIALTNRQVVVAFVILLICLMGTFFAGVWVGRGEAPRAGAGTAAEQTQAEDGAVEELDFFGGGEEAAPQESEQPPQQAPEQLPTEEPPAAPARPQRTPPAPGPSDAAGGEGAAIPAGQADNRPRAVETPPPTPRPVPREGAPVTGPIVQVFSTSDRARAQEVVDELVDAGQPAYLEPGEVNGRTVFRVRIGPFEDRAEAERVADLVRRRHHLDTLVMSQ